MKKVFNYFKHNLMLLVFILICTFFMPAALFSPGESNNRAIVTAIGLDKQDDEYEISLLTFIPTPNQTFLESNSVISGKGETVAKAISNAELTLGKKVGFSHAKTTIVSEGVLKEDVAKDIDYLSRVAALSENTVFICTNESAKDFLLASQSLEKDIGLKLDELISYNIKTIYSSDTTLEGFYKGYYSENRASILGYLELKEATGDGVQQGTSGGSNGGSASSGGGGSSGGSSGGTSEGSGGGSGSSGGSSGSQGESKKVFNYGDVVLLKNGVMVARLNEEQLEGINLLNQNSVNQIVTVENVSNETYNNASLTYIIRNKRVMITTKFENGYPIFGAEIVLGLELIEAKEAEGSIVNDHELTSIPHEAKIELESKIRKNFADTLSILRAKRTDVIGVREKFELENRKNFHKFLQSLDDPDDFLNYVTFSLALRIDTD